MRCGWIVLAAGLCVLPAGTRAQDEPRPSTPYKPVAASLPAPSAPPGLDAFRARLLEIAASRDPIALRPEVASKFFWGGDSEEKFDRKKSGFDNFSAALVFDEEEGNLGWANLAHLASYAAAPHGRRRNVFCSPARPRYAASEVKKLLAATDSEASEWAAARIDGLKVRLHPRDEAETIETLGLHLVLIDGAEPPKATDFRAWSIVMTPSGKRGYVLATDLVTLFNDRLCYAKDSGGAWRIAGYVASGE